MSCVLCKECCIGDRTGLRLWTGTGRSIGGNGRARKAIVEMCMHSPTVLSSRGAPRCTIGMESFRAGDFALR